MAVKVRIDKQGAVRCGRRFPSGKNCDFYIGKFTPGDPAFTQTHFLIANGWRSSEDDPERFTLTVSDKRRFEEARRNGSLGSFIPNGRAPHKIKDKQGSLTDQEALPYRAVNLKHIEISCPNCLAEIHVDVEDLINEYRMNIAG